MPTRLMLRTSPPTQPPPIWPLPVPIRPHLRQQLPPRHPHLRALPVPHLHLLTPSKAPRSRIRVLTRITARIRTIRAMECSRLLIVRSRLPRCPSMTSHRLPATVTCGRPAIGLGRHQAITGCPAPGLKLLMRVLCGRQATGAGDTTVTSSTGAIGADTSATTAASTMASAISASATRAAIGITTISDTTAL
jgi:hypothetical protein